MGGEKKKAKQQQKTHQETQHGYLSAVLFMGRYIFNLQGWNGMLWAAGSWESFLALLCFDTRGLKTIFFRSWLEGSS